MHLVAFYRSPSFSPGQHRDNDAAILDAVVANIVAVGHRVTRSCEREVEAGNVPAADGYLNMCQGPIATRRLIDSTAGRMPVINSGTGVLNCHRARMVSLLDRAGVPFPETVILPSRGYDLGCLARLIAGAVGPVWVKRGDVHAQVADDVVAVSPTALESAIDAFADRGITTVAVQAHVPGPVVKFYGVTGTSFFHAYLAAPNGTPESALDFAALAVIARQAATTLELEAFGGDAVFSTYRTPVLIDLNDWPSYAPVRDQAATAIATRFLHLFGED